MARINRILRSSIALVLVTLLLLNLGTCAQDSIIAQENYYEEVNALEFMDVDNVLMFSTGTAISPKPEEDDKGNGADENMGTGDTTEGEDNDNIKEEDKSSENNDAPKVGNNDPDGNYDLSRTSYDLSGSNTQILRSNLANDTVDMLDSVINVDIPEKFKFYMDPHKLTNDEAIYSDVYEIKNYGNQGVYIDIDSIYLCVNENLTVVSYGDYFSHDSADSIRIFLAIQFNNGSIIPITISEENYSQVVYLGASNFNVQGEFESFNDNSIISFRFIGDIMLGSQKPAKNDISAKMTINYYPSLFSEEDYLFVPNQNITSGAAIAKPREEYLIN